ncbi:MAG: hypothetical protein AAFV53_24055 [Myxococcota bacterium]
MIRNLMLASAILFAVGCVDSGKDSGDDGSDSGTTGADPTFSVEWGGSAVSLTITNGDSAGSYFFGMAETGSTCAADPSQCWTGEDCLEGFGKFFYCHPSSTTGVSLSYGGAFDALTEGSQTVFGDSSFDGSVTYYVEENGSGDCYIGGNDTSYYSGLGCTTVSF